MLAQPAPLLWAPVIYDRPVWQLMADAADDIRPPYTAEAIDAWFRENFPKIKPGTVAAHIRGLTVNDPSRHHYPGLAAKAPLFFRTASGELVRFDAATHSSQAASPGAARRPRKAALRSRRAYLDPRVTASIQALPPTHGFDHTKLLRLMAELDDNFARETPTLRTPCSELSSTTSRRCLAAPASAQWQTTIPGHAPTRGMCAGCSTSGSRLTTCSAARYPDTPTY